MNGLTRAVLVCDGSGDDLSVAHMQRHATTLHIARGHGPTLCGPIGGNGGGRPMRTSYGHIAHRMCEHIDVATHHYGATHPYMSHPAWVYMEWVVWLCEVNHHTTIQRMVVQLVDIDMSCRNNTVPSSRFT